jgi:nitrile hydratase subunit beta
MSYVSHADLGGVRGFGSVAQDNGGALPDAAWEWRVLALTVAMGATGSWNLDMSRSVRETLPLYLSLSYYQIWLAALEKLLLAKGLVTQDELATGEMLVPPVAIGPVLRADQVQAVLATGAPTERKLPGAARFRCGDTVRTLSAAAPHHTRLPGYLRGKIGVIERVHGAHVFADAAADAGHRVSFDAWEPYLESA